MVWKALSSSVQLRSLGIPLVICTLWLFLPLQIQDLQVLTWTEISLFIFFVSPGDSGFFIPSFLSLSSLLLGASGLDSLAIPAEPPSPPMFFALLCVSWAVFSHDVSFLSVKWFFKTWGSPQVVKGVCLYQRMTPVPSTALAAGGKQMKRGWTTFFRS